MPVKTTPKEVFLHLLEFVALYAVVIGFISLLFQYVNLLIPDVLERGFYATSSYYSIARRAMATLIVIFPVYLFTAKYLNKLYLARPERQHSRLRKWLGYFTLFIAGGTVLIDLVTLIYNFLQGDLTTRFILKVLSILLVAALVFVYYLWDLKRDREA